MALEYTEQVTVRVWRNIKTAGFMPTAHFGHASVEARAPYLGRYEREQISYWPGSDGGAGKGMSGLRNQPHSTHTAVKSDKMMEMNRLTALRLEVGYRQQNGIAYPSIWDEVLAAEGKSPLNKERPGQKRTTETWYSEEMAADFPLWSQSQESKVKLPALKHLRGDWGLAIKPMIRWWQKFQAFNPPYRALSTNNNCAGVALMALEAGGAGAFLPLPTIFLYAEPSQVEHYATGLRSVIEQLEIATKKLEIEVKTAKAANKIKPIAGPQLGGIWTPQEWKKQSALGPLQPRSLTIREIDDGLSAFHDNTWSADYQKKFAGFVKMFRGIAKHRAEKSDSARTAAVLSLASQALDTLKGSGALHD